MSVKTGETREYYEELIKQIGEWFIDNAENIMDDLDTNSIRSIKFETIIECNSIPTITTSKEYFPKKIGG